MARRLGVIMDPIAGINPKKDTTLALLLAAQNRGFELYYMEMADLALIDGKAMAHMRERKVHNALDHWFHFVAAQPTAGTQRSASWIAS